LSNLNGISRYTPSLLARLCVGLLFAVPLVCPPPVQATEPAATDKAADEDAGAVHPEFTDEQVAFYRERVQPILERHCYKCHGPGEEPKSNFRLTTRSELLAGGEYGEAVYLEEPSASPLLTAVSYEELEMPPSGRLAVADVDVLRRWVEMGAPYPADKLEAADDEHGEGPLVDEEARNYWAYQPVARPEEPTVQDGDWVRNGIDSFIRARLEAANLEPAPPADRRTLARRVYYDLTGLPPTPDEMESFLSDTSPKAYERLVDRLLDSPQYGEKWGRHWLDVVRYAETDGYERDNAKPNVWRYRDYVIRAFNDDKPYDQFILEQLAGDELPEVTPDSLIATGFQRLGLWDDEPVDADQAYYDSLDDVVRTTGEVFLAMTVGCARCHDHKIDPMPQTDYYRLLAFFNNTYKNIKQLKYKKSAFTLNTQRVIATEAERAAHAEQVAAHKEELDRLKAELAEFDERVLAALSPPEQEDAKDAKVRRLLLAKRRPSVLSAEDNKRHEALAKQLKQLKKHKLPSLPTALAMKENGPQAPPTHVLIRGNVHAPGDEVQPGLPEVLGFDDPIVPEPPEDAESCGRRLALARWLIDPANPLTARVMVNRIWQHHFGRGIVSTPNDFGKAGTRPSHPRLLDWLAAEFVASGWRIKEMHRRMMLSSTYRMSSRASEAALAADPDNRLLSRFPLRRLTAEEIRDAILLTSGELNRKMGGPSVYTQIPSEVLASASRPEAAWGESSPDDQRRRSIYIHVKRSLVEPVLQTFDAADNQASCAARFVTTVPTQALTMLNSEFFNQQAALLARRLEREAGDDPASQVERAIRLALSREAEPDEIRRGVELLSGWQEDDQLFRKQALEQFCLMIYNLNEFVYID